MLLALKRHIWEYGCWKWAIPITWVFFIGEDDGQPAFFSFSPSKISQPPLLRTHLFFFAAVWCLKPLPKFSCIQKLFQHRRCRRCTWLELKGHGFGMSMLWELQHIQSHALLGLKNSSHKPRWFILESLLRSKNPVALFICGSTKQQLDHINGWSSVTRGCEAGWKPTGGEVRFHHSAPSTPLRRLPGCVFSVWTVNLELKWLERPWKDQT